MGLPLYKINQIVKIHKRRKAGFGAVFFWSIFLKKHSLGGDHVEKKI
jgi:hypothetical protein